MSDLPSLPSALIRLALADLEKCEGDSRYCVVMNTVWHTPSNNVCYVCLAGAVMAKTLRIPNDRWYSPEQSVYRKQLSALDAFRSGLIARGLSYLSLTRPAILPRFIDIPEYCEDREAFHKAMLGLADLLESHSL